MQASIDNNLKKQNSKAKIPEQYIKCYKSPIYFLQHYTKIQDVVNGQLIDFKLYPFQKQVMNNFKNYSRNIILKSRQIGISTLVAGYALWMITFNQNKTILVIADKKQDAMNMITKVKIMYESLPKWLKIPLTRNNVKSLYFKNNSWIKCVASTPSAGASQAVSLLVFDEMALVEEPLQGKIWASSQPTLTKGGSCILLSTPRGCVIGDTKILIRNIDNKQIREIKIENLNNYNQYEILTSKGWSRFEGLRTLKRKRLIKVKTNDCELICTPDHKLKMNDETFKEVKYLNVNEILYNNQIIKEITKINNENYINVYDVVNVEYNNQYYTEGLISHNCGSTFHKLWTQAEAGINSFHAIKLPWYLDPTKNQQWRDNQTVQLGQKMAAREYDCDFETSGDTIINSELLKELQSNYIKEPIRKAYSNLVWIWQNPINSFKYILSADVARGDGVDFSTFEILCIQTNQQVAQFKGKIGTTQFGNLIVQYAKLYNDAFVVVENASIGWAVLQQIINLNYRNLYYHKKDFKYIDPQLHNRIHISPKQQEKKDIVGFTTSSSTRPLIIQKFIKSIENKQILIRSARLLEELRTFIWMNGKQQAMPGYNDDLIMAMAIGIWVRFTTYVLQVQVQNLNRERLALINTNYNIEREKKVGILQNDNSNYMYDQHKINIAGQEIDLWSFYFNKRKK